MEYKAVALGAQKRIALVAHDHMKAELVDWARKHDAQLRAHLLLSTGSTGRVLESELGLSITKLKSGPLGGDQQIGARIAQGEVDVLIFFWDPLEPLSHDPDIKALLRLAQVWNIPVVSNRASADFLFSSPYMDSEYTRLVPVYERDFQDPQGIEKRQGY